MPKYKVLQGISYPPNKRAEVGDVVEDIPAQSIKWLREQGIIEPLDPKAKDPEVKPAADATKEEVK